MRKIGAVVLFLALVFPAKAAVTFRAGLWCGPQKINDAKIRSVYGGQTVFLPYLEIQIWKGLTIGGGYEFGYNREGKIGLHDNPTTFRMSGLDFFLGYELRIKDAAFFAKIGYGLFSYKQTIDNPSLSDYKVDHTQSAVSFGAGLKYYPARFIFLAVEARYVPLKVKPYDYEVDLGGFRYMAGLGFAFDI